MTQANGKARSPDLSCYTTTMRSTTSANPREKPRNGDGAIAGLAAGTVLHAGGRAAQFVRDFVQIRVVQFLGIPLNLVGDFEMAVGLAVAVHRAIICSAAKFWNCYRARNCLGR